MNVHDAAATIIRSSRSIDALKLQKLLFIAAGEYLAMTGHTMFEEPIEAWDYGPVVHSVYTAYKSTEGERAITEPVQGDPDNLNDTARCCCESVVATYGHLTGPQLIRVTHEMRPWRESYRQGAYRTEIPSQLVYDHFSQSPSAEQLAEALSAWNQASGVPV